MKPFKELRTYGKAKLLFDLFPEQAAESINYIRQVAGQFQTDPEIIDDFQTPDFWKEVTGQVLKSLDYCKRKIYRNSGMFADQLFDGYLAVFSTHCLRQYAGLPEVKGSKFSKAIELFF